MVKKDRRVKGCWYIRRRKLCGVDKNAEILIEETSTLGCNDAQDPMTPDYSRMTRVS